MPRAQGLKVKLDEAPNLPAEPRISGKERGFGIVFILSRLFSGFKKSIRG